MTIQEFISANFPNANLQDICEIEASAQDLGIDPDNISEQDFDTLADLALDLGYSDSGDADTGPDLPDPDDAN